MRQHPKKDCNVTHLSKKENADKSTKNRCKSPQIVKIKNQLTNINQILDQLDNAASKTSCHHCQHLSQKYSEKVKEFKRIVAQYKTQICQLKIHNGQLRQKLDQFLFQNQELGLKAKKLEQRLGKIKKIPYEDILGKTPAFYASKKRITSSTQLKSLQNFQQSSSNQNILEDLDDEFTEERKIISERNISHSSHKRGKIYVRKVDKLKNDNFQLSNDHNISSEQEN